jgi:hypothetical protein
MGAVRVSVAVNSKRRNKRLIIANSPHRKARESRLICFSRATAPSCPQVHEQSQELFGLLRTVTQLTQMGDEMGPAAAALSHTASSVVPPPPSSMPMPRTTETTLSHPEVEEVCVRVSPLLAPQVLAGVPQREA